MSLSQKQLKFAYWNIEGLRLSDCSPKSSDERFMKEVIKHDIFCISETHCDENQNISIENYKTFKISRSRNKKNNRCYGGIAIWYKSSLAKGLTFLNHKNNDYIWIKLCRYFFNTTQDTYLCVAYIPPENSPFYKTRGENTLSYIESDIMKYKNEGSIMLVGDLNARTRTELDYIVYDNDKYMSDRDFYTSDKEIIPRNSQDIATPCVRGKALLELCNAAQIRIINGRSIGDINGKYTCHKYNGSSVVDYLITSENNMKNILYMEVSEIFGDLSDHCSISWSLKCDYALNSIPNDSSKPFPETFSWDTSSIMKFQNAFTHKDIVSKIKDFIAEEFQLNSSGIDTAVQKVTEIYIQSAKSSLPKKVTKKTKSKGN